MILVDKIALLIPYQNMFTASQINKLAEAITPSLVTYRPPPF